MSGLLPAGTVEADAKRATASTTLIVEEGVLALCEDVRGSVQEQLCSLGELVGLGGS